MNPNKVDIITLTIFLVAYFQKLEIPITSLKVHKLLYFLQAWHIVFFDKKKFFEELPEAWISGPVFRKVWDNLKFTKDTPLSIKLKNGEDFDVVFEQME